MLFSSFLSLILLFGANAHPTTKQHQKAKRLDVTTVDEFNTFEYPIALQGLFANIGTGGSKASGAGEGVVLASPSKSKFVSLK